MFLLRGKSGENNGGILPGGIAIPIVIKKAMEGQSNAGLVDQGKKKTIREGRRGYDGQNRLKGTKSFSGERRKASTVLLCESYKKREIQGDNSPKGWEGFSREGKEVLEDVKARNTRLWGGGTTKTPVEKLPSIRINWSQVRGEDRSKRGGGIIQTGV